MNCEDRQDVCPLGKVFSIRETPRALTPELYPSAVCGIANLCNTSTVRSRVLMNGRAIVNFGYGSGAMHIALNAWMADSATTIQTSSSRGRSMFGLRRDKATEIARRPWSQDLLLTIDIDAELPDRPSLEGYKVETLPLERVAQLFKNHAKDRI